MTATIKIKDDTLVVKVEGQDKLWALKSRLEVPLEDVVGAELASDEAHKWFHGLRFGGSHIPGALSVGRFHNDGQWVFWDVHDPDKAIVIRLRRQHFARLVVEVADAEAEIDRIESAVGLTASV
jgi:hypothetical protein